MQVQRIDLRSGGTDRRERELKALYVLAERSFEQRWWGMALSHKKL